MLSKEVMGALALGILWINALLIAAAAWKTLHALWQRGAQMKALGGEGVGLARGRVARGRVAGDRGDGAALAVRRVEQVGRAADGEPRVIVFADRAGEGEVLGGVVKLDTGVEVEVLATPEGEVWIRREELVLAGECPSDEAFDAAYEGARKARGAARTVSAEIGADREVFLFGHFRQKGAGLSLGPARDGGVLIATMDPRRWIDGKVRLIALFIVAELAVAAGCTFVALYPPHFELVSKIGGVLCLGFFLLVQPAGTMVREAARTPGQALLGGSWARRRSAPEQPPDATSELVRAREPR